MQSSVGIGLQYIPRIPSNIFCYISKFSNRIQILPSKLRYSNSPLEILCADFRALGHVCREKYKILQWNPNSPIESRICKFSNRIQIPHSPRVPEILPVNVKKGLLRNKPISKDHTLCLLHPFTTFGA